MESEGFSRREILGVSRFDSPGESGVPLRDSTTFLRAPRSFAEGTWDASRIDITVHGHTGFCSPRGVCTGAAVVARTVEIVKVKCA